MRSKQNPFPGMNPFMERSWLDVHTVVVAGIRDAIALAGLPDELRARAEERLIIEDEGDHAPRHYRADTAISEAWKEGKPPEWSAGETGPGGVILAMPTLVYSDAEVERWVEITTRDGTLVTVIEVLSPSNKEESQPRYQQKQRDYRAAGVNVVEIDLLRCGRHTVGVPLRLLKKTDGTRYLICVERGSRPGWHEVYEWPLKDRVPAVRIPLRPTDKDVALDLQPLIDRCYELGAYWQEDFSVSPEPPLTEAEQAWATEKLKAASLLP